MKLIEPSVELIEQEPGIEGMYKHIERCARVCYRSENKGNVTSEQFVKSLIKRKHFRPLEFGTIPVKPKGLISIIKWKLRSIFNPWVIKSEKFYITNLRYLIEHEEKTWEKLINSMPNVDVNRFRPTLHWHISRCIADEFRTHVMLSSLMESTRYVNYKNGVEFMKPYWFDNFNKPCDKDGHREDGTSDMFDSKNFVEFLKNCERNYLCAIIAGAKPQEARVMLSFCIATNFVQCGFTNMWENFFNQRCDKAADPDAQIIANKAKEIINNEKV